MKKIFFEKKINEVSKKSEVVLTEEGHKELERLESIYLSKMSGGIRSRYSHYSDEEKLKALISKKNNEKKGSSLIVSEKKIPMIEYISSKNEFEWLNLDIEKLEDAEKTFKSYLEEIAVAKELLLTERIEKELSTLMEQRSDIDAKILELQNAKVNILGTVA